MWRASRTRWAYELRKVNAMKRQLLNYCLIGAPVGLALSTLITIAISLFTGDGNYYPATPELIADCGSELNAVAVQALFSLLYGALLAGASVIWQHERWSILRQTATHLAVCSLATFPAAYFMRWMQHSTAGILTYFGIFIAIYAAVWLIIYLNTRRRIRRINARLRNG